MSMVLTGLVTTSLGFVGWLPSVWGLILIVPLVVLFFSNKHFYKLFNQLKWFDCYLLSILGLIWISHLIQVFVPETGFDAVWYHLPVAQVIEQNHKIIFVPELYQSLNPLFSDLFFILGFQLASDLGTKLVAYFFGLSLVAVSYMLGRIWLNRNWSLLFVVIISTFQVVAWQAASFYVDVAKAFWEVAALYFIFNMVERRYALAGVLFGASLATKLFSLGLWPFFSLLVLIKSESKKKTIIFVISSLIVVLPFYIFAYLHTGNPFYSVSVHLQKLSEIGGSSSVWQYIFDRLILFPTSFVTIIFSKDYTAPFLFLSGTFILLAGYKLISKSTDLKLLLLFVLNQWLIWWFVPPLSTRYALSGFIILGLVLVVLLRNFYQNYSLLRKPIMALCILTIVVNMLPRFYVNYRSLSFLISGQPKEIYLKQFYDGSIDQPLKNWHQITE